MSVSGAAVRPLLLRTMLIASSMTPLSLERRSILLRFFFATYDDDDDDDDDDGSSSGGGGDDSDSDSDSDDDDSYSDDDDSYSDDDSNDDDVIDDDDDLGDFHNVFGISQTTRTINDRTLSFCHEIHLFLCTIISINDDSSRVYNATIILRYQFSALG